VEWGFGEEEYDLDRWWFSSSSYESNSIGMGVAALLIRVQSHVNNVVIAKDVYDASKKCPRIHCLNPA